MWQRIHPVRIYSLDIHDALLLAAGTVFFSAEPTFFASIVVWGDGDAKKLD